MLARVQDSNLGIYGWQSDTLVTEPMPSKL